MSNKTLLQINVTANWGSTGKIAEQIGVCAQRNGWESYVAYGRYMNPSENRLIKIGSQFDVYEHYAENRLLDGEGLASRHATRRFLQEMDRIRPDIVHLHNIHDHYLNYPLLFSYLAEKNIPIVWTFHDCWAFTGHCMYYPSECERWQTECHDCPQTFPLALDRSRRNHMMKKKMIESLPNLTIVPVSEWLADCVRRSYLKNRPLEVIHNGIDIHQFSPQTDDVHERYGIAPDKKIVLGVASVWDTRKGLADIYTLAWVLPAEEYAIVVVGQLREKSQDVAGCQMVFVARTQNVLELAQLYSSASVYINPTYQDNYPTTNLESLACGTPVITYRTGGSPEAVEEATGVVVEQGNVTALAAAVETVCRRGKATYHTACRQRALRCFDKDKCFSQYINLYNEIL